MLTDLIHDVAWTAGQLAAAVTARSRDLETQGIAAGDRVIIAHGGTPAFFADLFAVWSLGGCAVCLNQSLTRNEVDNLNTFIRPALTLEEGLPRPSSEEPADILAINQPKTREALVLFTSGTTGDPKGVVHTFGSLSARIALNLKHIPQGNLARSLCVLPTHFGHGLIGNCLTPLAAGSDLFLLPAPDFRRIMTLGALLNERDITFMSSVPAFWKIALKGARPTKQTLKQLGIGSAPLAAALIEEISGWTGCPDVRNMYGITETANWIAGASTLEEPARDGYVGRPWGGEAAVLGENGKPQATGEGEILIRSDALMAGYYNRPDLTESVFHNGWFRTGDKGIIDPNGGITLTGRLKNEINRAGMKISPEEIDLLLEGHPAVAEACAFGLDDPIAGEIVGIALALKDGAAFTQSDFRAWCGERIRTECIPERWFVLPDIPKTDRGKLNRDTVKAVCLEEKDQ